MHPIHPIGPQTQVLVCFVMFRCILDLFCYCTKLGAKRIELVQLMKKFVPRNRIRVFRNERTRSTPLDTKLLFWCLLYCLSEFGTVSWTYESRCKTNQTSAKVRSTKFHREHTRSTPLDPKLMFCCLSYCLSEFGTVS